MMALCDSIKRINAICNLLYSNFRMMTAMHFKKTRLLTLFLVSFFMLPFSTCSFFKKEKESINVIHQIQEMSEMATVEFVVSKVVQVNDVPDWYKIGDRKLLISTKARIKAGTNRKEIGDEDIEITGNSIELRIPHARVINLNMDPESIQEEYSRTGFFRRSFTNEERYGFLVQAEKEIYESIPQMGVLNRANAHSVAFFESWLRAMGFEQVHVVVKPMEKEAKQP